MCVAVVKPFRIAFADKPLCFCSSHKPFRDIHPSGLPSVLSSSSSGLPNADASFATSPYFLQFLFFNATTQLNNYRHGGAKVNFDDIVLLFSRTSGEKKTTTLSYWRSGIIKLSKSGTFFC